MVRRLDLNFPKINATGSVVIKDDTAVFTMSSQEHLKALYDAEVKTNPDIKLEGSGFFKKTYRMIQRFPGLTEKQVEDTLILELSASGVEVKDKNV